MDVSRDDYLDVNDALKRIGGNLDLYKKLLKRFIDGNDFEALVKALDSGDAEESKRLAHTIKGVSANLSLKRIRAASTELELILKDNLNHAPILTELKEAYEITIKLIVEFTA